ncbi:MAG: NADH-quinone oxidoreductase subunit H [Deltaproteobacteria bacterium]|nr:MAG: NADH-quinone oxidoreductase subunit H [Deltaproteobacteria bacterium]
MSVGELILFGVLKFVAIVFGWVMVIATLLTYNDRKQSAAAQNRIGPNRALLFGKRFPLSHHIGQILADALKVLAKEDFEPPRSNKLMHQIAPALVLVPVMLAWLVIPFGPGPMPGAEGEHWFQIANLNVGLLFLFAIMGIGVYGGVLGAWASNSAYSLLGGLRGAAQMVSYEITLGLNLVGIFMIYGSMELNEIIWAQGELAWGIVTQPLAFILFLTAAMAETQKAPFDLTEAESELVAGYFTEYSSMRFAVYALAEYIGIIVVAAIGACCFLGGWQIPFVETPVDASGVPIYGWITVAQVAAFLFKMLLLVWLQTQIRWTLPRFRYDQVMKLGWLVLLPLSVLNLIVTAFVMYLVA